MIADESTASLAPALGRLPSGLFIMTVGRGVHGTGQLVSWVQQCSFEPPSISVALKQGRALSGLLTNDEPFVLNQLAVGQTQFLTHFGRGFDPGEPAFLGIDLEDNHGGPAILSKALAHLKCRVESRFSAGDHDLIIGRVVGGRLHGDAAPYIHTRSSGLRY